VDKNTLESPDKVLLEDTVVGELTRKEILGKFNVSKVIAHERFNPHSKRRLIKDVTESTIGDLPYVFRTYHHQNKLEREERSERIEERRSVPETPKRIIPKYDKASYDSFQ
jgi:hypothetical protein